MKPSPSQPVSACPGLDPASTGPRGRMVPVCSWCQKVRDESGRWSRAGAAPRETAGALLTHGVCPECRQRHFPRRKAAA